MCFLGGENSFPHLIYFIIVSCHVFRSLNAACCNRCCNGACSKPQLCIASATQPPNSTGLKRSKQHAVFMTPPHKQGLATPYVLVPVDPTQGPCSMSTMFQQAFVNAAIVDLDKGVIYNYIPLVVGLCICLLLFFLSLSSLGASDELSN